jgi:hypothetical protein
VRWIGGGGGGGGGGDKAPFENEFEVFNLVFGCAS